MHIIWCCKAEAPFIVKSKKVRGDERVDAGEVLTRLVGVI